MRRILVISPISTPGLGKDLLTYLQTCSDGESYFDIESLADGPSSIELLSDEVTARVGVIEKARQAAGNYDGIVVNCFADPGVLAARAASGLPVVGPGESSMLLATFVGHKFGVISVLRNSKAWVELQAAALGVSSRLAYSSGIDLGVLELAGDHERTCDLILAEAEKALDAGAEVIVLGCTGMVRVARAVGERLSVPVIEPLSAAVRTVEALVDLRIPLS